MIPPHNLLIPFYNQFLSISFSTPNIQRAPIPSTISESIPPNFSYLSSSQLLHIYPQYPTDPLHSCPKMLETSRPIPLSATSTYAFFMDGISCLSGGHIRLTPSLSVMTKNLLCAENLIFGCLVLILVPPRCICNSYENIRGYTFKAYFLRSLETRITILVSYKRVLKQHARSPGTKWNFQVD